MLADKFNATESAIKTFLEGRSDISAEVSYFHEKLIDDIYRYTSDQLPAVAVAAIGYEEAGIRRERIECVVEVVTAAGDLAVADGKCKEIMSLIINNLVKEDPRIGGRGISDAFEEIAVESGGVVPPDKSSHGFTVVGMININAVING